MKKLTKEEKLEILLDYISCLEEDDKENSITNATRCIEDGGILELQNIVYNNQYRAGKNHFINELREAIGMPVLVSKDRTDWRLGAAEMRSKAEVWDCPALDLGAYDIKDGGAFVISLGETGESMIVFGTKSKAKALRLMRRLQREYHDLDEDDLIEEGLLNYRTVVWRNPTEYDDGESTHYFSWSAKHRNNPKGVKAWVATLY